MVGLFGYMTGYDGTFPFESPGQKYNETRYVGMRVVCHVQPIVFISCKWLGFTRTLWNVFLVLYCFGINVGAFNVLNHLGND